MSTDVAVVGAGIVGLSTAFALRERGASVTVYERGRPGNAQSGGESRIFRHLHADPRLAGWAVESRAAWREWEDRFGCELLAADGVVALGDRRAAQAAGPGIREISAEEVAERLPLLARIEQPAVLDEAGGVLRVRAAIAALAGALEDALLPDEVLSVRETPSGTVELRAGGVTAEHGRVIVCAGRGTAALARGAGLELPVRDAAHVRLTYRVAGVAPARVACLLDGDGVFGEDAYGDPMPGNGAFALGVGETPAGADGHLPRPEELAADGARATAYVGRALPGLVPEPVEVRHCWVTELPWGHDGLGVWEAGPLLVVAGNNLFKHAPTLGRAAAGAALGDGLRDDLRPEAQLGADDPEVVAQR